MTATVTTRQTRVQGALDAAHEFYRSQFAGSWAEPYVTRDRGLSVEEQEAAGVGYAPAGWRSLAAHLRQLGIDEDTAVEAGVIARAANGHVYDRYRDRVVFPVRREDGSVAGFAGRKPETDTDQDSPKWLTPLNTESFSKRSTLYGLDRVTGSSVLVGEGVFDAHALDRAGAGDGVALLGTALTDEHCVALRDRGVETVTMVLDGDQAGVNAAAKAWSVLSAHNLTAYAVVPADGHDPADLSPAALGDQLRARRPLLDHVVDHRLGQWSTGEPLSAEEKVAAMRSLAPLLADVDPSTAANQITRAALQLDLSQESALSLAGEMVASPAAATPRRLSEVAPSTADAPTASDSAASTLNVQIAQAPAGSEFTISDAVLLGGETHVPAGVTVHLVGEARTGALTGDGMVTLTDSAKADRVGGRLTVPRLDGASVVTVLGDTASVEVMTAQSRIARMGDHSSVGRATHGAQIGFVGANARLGRLDHSASVGTVCDYASVDVVTGGARVGIVGDKASVNSVGGSAAIAQVTGGGRVGTLTESAVVERVYENGRIDRLTDRSKVSFAAGRAHIGTLRDASRVETARGNVVIGSLKDTSTLGSRGPMVHVSNVGRSARIEESKPLSAEERGAVEQWRNRNRPAQGRRGLRPPRVGYMATHASRLLTAEIRRELRDGDKREAAHQALDR